MVFLIAWLISIPALAQQRNIPDDLPNPITLTVTDAVTGDRGCYIHGVQSTVDGTREWDLMGEFGCEAWLVPGLLYSFEWGEQNVLAASCEGDVDCGLSDVEPLVRAATLVQPPESSACREAETSSARNACASAKAAVAQSELDAVLKHIRLQYAENEGFLVKLRDAQTAWEAYRTAQIAARYPHLSEPGHYGNGHRVCLAAYKENLTRKRISELQPWLDGDENDDGCAGSVKRTR